jgi:N-acetylglucosaminyldiphosphoundecaprenol N-acetyl-beta-D-mannosaminyltransferase
MDFIFPLCEEFSNRGIRVYLLGAKEGVAHEASERLRQKFPDLQIVGTQHGYFRPEENGRIIDAINIKRPHILIVGMGVPLQEKWIVENAAALKVPVLWGVGGLFDFLSGRTWRGPPFLRDNGFEWLCRLIAEPTRLWRRYLIGNTKFLTLLLWHRLFWKR